MVKLNNTVAIIDFLGGNEIVAEMLDAHPKAVANWRYSGLFPADTYLALQQAMKDNGISAPDRLWPMRRLMKVKA
jgi:hypothetical protein